MSADPATPVDPEEDTPAPEGPVAGDKHRMMVIIPAETRARALEAVGMLNMTFSAFTTMAINREYVCNEHLRVLRVLKSGDVSARDVVAMFNHGALGELERAISRGGQGWR